MGTDLSTKDCWLLHANPCSLHSSSSSPLLSSPLLSSLPPPPPTSTLFSSTTRASFLRRPWGLGRLLCFRGLGIAGSRWDSCPNHPSVELQNPSRPQGTSLPALLPGTPSRQRVSSPFGLFPFPPVAIKASFQLQRSFPGGTTVPRFVASARKPRPLAVSLSYGIFFLPPHRCFSSVIEAGRVKHFRLSCRQREPKRTVSEAYSRRLVSTIPLTVTPEVWELNAFLC